jgi:hypothetical protein
LSEPCTAITTIRVRARPAASPSGPVAIVRPIVPKKPTVTNDPIMKTSPWAKLISSMIPYTSV